MRIRTIKPEWLEDERTACASPEARVMSIALILMADDHGRGRASVAMLGGRIFPGSANPREDAAKAREELRAARYITIYESGGQEYYHIRNWAKHQRVDRPSASQLPAPPDESEQKPLSLSESANVREDHAKDREEAPSPRVALAPDLDLDRGPGPGEDRGPAREAPPPLPPRKVRRRDPLDYHRAHPVYVAALTAMDQARQAAGWGPLTDSALPNQTALGLACCAAEDLAAAKGLQPAEVLATAAKGFVATRKPGARLEWWAENFGDFWQAGSSAPTTKLDDLEAEQARLVALAARADPDTQAELNAKILSIAAERRRLRGAA